jgi:heme exporter protein C
VSSSTPGVRLLGGVTVVGFGLLALLALVVSPADELQGDSVRLMYVHVPSAWLAYLSFGVTALGSVLYLWRRTRSRSWDLLAGASAEVGVLFTGLTLLTGMIWGRATWGVWWTWDARLTTTALLFVLFLGYLALRRVPTEVDVRSRRAAIAGLVGFANVPIVHQSVEWWRTLHQEPTVLRRDLDPQIDDLMLFTLFLGGTVFTSLYAWLTIHRFRVGWLEERVERRVLDAAIVERRAEGADAGGVAP